MASFVSGCRRVATTRYIDFQLHEFAASAGKRCPTPVAPETDNENSVFLRSRGRGTLAAAPPGALVSGKAPAPRVANLAGLRRLLRLDQSQTRIKGVANQTSFRLMALT